MTKATEHELAVMHGAIARGLTDILTEGVDVVVKGRDGEAEIVKTPASAAYYMAAITFAKNNSITADAGTNAELDALSKALQERRQAAKGKMSRPTVEAVAEQFERELGAGFNQ